MTSHYTFWVRDHPTWFWRCLGLAFGHFHLGSYNFMVTALGSCVNWPSLGHLFLSGTDGMDWVKPHDLVVCVFIQMNVELEDDFHGSFNVKLSHFYFSFPL